MLLFYLIVGFLVCWYQLVLCSEQYKYLGQKSSDGMIHCNKNALDQLCISVLYWTPEDMKWFWMIKAKYETLQISINFFFVNFIYKNLYSLTQSPPISSRWVVNGPPDYINISSRILSLARLKECHSLLLPPRRINSKWRLDLSQSTIATPLHKPPLNGAARSPSTTGTVLRIHDDQPIHC